MTLDRHVDGYEPRFDIDLEYGRQGELFIGSVVEALKADRIEVKRDGKFARTGNLYVEFECRNRGQWRDSGLKTTDAALWAFVLGDSGLAIIVPTELLKEVCRLRYHAGHVAEETDGSNPTRGVLLPVQYLMGWVRERRAA